MSAYDLSGAVGDSVCSRGPGTIGPVLLSDRDIRTELDAGRVVLDPCDPEMIQPASIDVRLDRWFRLFDNHRYPVIDPAADQEGLTHLEIGRAHV